MLSFACMAFTIAISSCSQSNGELIESFEKSCQENNTSKATKQAKEILERKYKGEFTKEQERYAKKVLRKCDCLENDVLTIKELEDFEEELEKKYK